jgi:hypothetical protein
MLATETIEREFEEKVGAELRLRPQGRGRYRISTPFMFDDGDHLKIILKELGNQWVLSDEGHTFMHLTYGMDEQDFSDGPRREIIESVLSAFDVADQDGSLVMPVDDAHYADALYSFIQAILRINNVTYLQRERVVSTFLADLRQLLSEAVPSARLTTGWHDPVRDPEANYRADYRINGVPRPLMVFALPNDAATRLATITIHQYKGWGLSFRSLGIFEDQTQIGRRDLARFTDVSTRMFASLGPRPEITEYLEEIMAEAA